MHTHMYVYIHTYMYTYSYIRIHIHIHIYIYIFNKTAANFCLLLQNAIIKQVYGVHKYYYMCTNSTYLYHLFEFDVHYGGDMTHAYVDHDSFICGTCIIHMWNGLHFSDNIYIYIYICIYIYIYICTYLYHLFVFDVHYVS